MDVTYPGFGEIVVDGEHYDHDIVIEDGRVRKRDKKPSRSLKSRYGHTPLSESEDLPWSKARLIVGSGYSGRLPILPEIHEQARERDVEVVVLPTAEACRLLNEAGVGEVNAILHVTC